MRDIFNKLKKITPLDLTKIGIAEILGTGITGIFWFYLATLLNSDEYGRISYFISIASITSIICLFGFENTLRVYRGKGAKIQSTVFFISIISSISSSIIVFILFQDVGASSLIIGYVIAGLVSSEFLGRKMFTTYSRFLIISKILSATLPLISYYIIGNDGIMVGLAIANIPYAIIVCREIKNSKIDFNSLKPYKGFILNNSILQIIGSTYKSGDKILIGAMLGFISLGNYYLAIQFYTLFMIIPQVIYRYLLPYDSTGKPNIKLKKITIVFSALTSILGFFLSPVIIPYLFPKYDESIQIIQILSLNVVPGTLCLILYSKFLGNENSRTVMIAYGIQAGVQLFCILIFGNIIGVKGVAIAYVLGTSIQALYLIRKANYRILDIFRKKI